MVAREQSLKSQPDDRLTFLKGFFRRPADVGSVVPSSSHLERRIVRVAHLSQAQSVVELGPGTGGTTRALLKALPASARLLAIELDLHFAEHVSQLEDRRLVVHQGSAQELSAAVSAHHLAAPDCIISGIPFSTMPATVGRAVIEAVCEALKPGGFFVAYQLRDAVAQIARPVLGEPELTEIEWLNVPPMRVYRWRVGA
ncbi:MAG: hypothetical protein RI906_2649 [Pseudomonadota bacterium]